MKNASHILLLFFINAIATIHSMELVIPQLPIDLVSQILDIHLLYTITNQNTTPTSYTAENILPTLRRSLVYFSMINKDCNKRVNDTQNICLIIRKLFQRFRSPGGCTLIAQQLKTPGSRNYISQSKQLFDDDLTPEKIISLHELGADLDYTADPGGRFEWPLLYWTKKNNLENVKQLLDLGANIDQSRCVSYQNYEGAISAAQKNKSMLALLLSYKPRNLYIFPALKQKNKEIFTMLINAPAENSTDRQLQLNDALKRLIAPQEKYNIDSIKLVLDHGAQSECILPEITSRILQHTINPQSMPQVPPLELFLTLCKYPATDTTKLDKTHASLNEVIDLANNMLKILDTCTQK